MVDRISKTQRSMLMSRIKGRNTRPELRVRSAIFRAGFRFRLHQHRLAGTPDIVLPRYRIAVFVHGCFWHGHHCTKGRRRPAENEEFWSTKLDRTIERDRAAHAALAAEGWSVRVLWECTLTVDVEALLSELSCRKSDASPPCSSDAP